MLLKSMVESEGPSFRNIFDPINTMFRADCGIFHTFFTASLLLLQSNMEGPSLLAQDDSFIFFLITDLFRLVPLSFNSTNVGVSWKVFGAVNNLQIL